MDRRKFIYATGAIITFTALASYTGIQFEDSDSDKNKRSDPSSFKEPVLKGISLGSNAPNPHNTQAWKFKLISETSMLFFVNEQRLLTATDPTTRQIHIGCGCFLECMKLGMLEYGFETNVTYFPSGEYSHNDIGTLPIAKIDFKEKNVTKNPLSKSIFKRRTSRVKYRNVRIKSDTFKTMLEFIEPKNTQITLINTSDELDKVLPTLAEGMNVETYTYRTHEESRKWFRENDTKIEEKRDGINLPGGGITGIKKWFAELKLKGLEEDVWHEKEMNASVLENHYKKVTSSKAIVTIKTDTNNFIDWIHAGEEYLRLQLACTQQNFYLHPLSQVLQEFDEMKKLRILFEQQMNIKNDEKIQMVVRIGKSKKPYRSYRRLPKDLVIS